MKFKNVSNQMSQAVNYTIHFEAYMQNGSKCIHFNRRIKIKRVISTTKIKHNYKNNSNNKYNNISKRR